MKYIAYSDQTIQLHYMPFSQHSLDTSHKSKMDAQILE